MKDRDKIETWKISKLYSGDVAWMASAPSDKNQIEEVKFFWEKKKRSQLEKNFNNKTTAEWKRDREKKVEMNTVHWKEDIRYGEEVEGIENMQIIIIIDGLF